jgi:hypothetical protein
MISGTKKKGGREIINEKKYYSKIPVIQYVSSWNSDPPGKNLKENLPIL